MIVATLSRALVGRARPDSQQACYEADHTIRRVVAGGEVDEQARTDSPKTADEPVAHVGVVVGTQRCQDAGLSENHPVSNDQDEWEENTDDTNDHSSLEEAFLKKRSS